MLNLSLTNSNNKEGEERKSIMTMTVCVCVGWETCICKENRTIMVDWGHNDIAVMHACKCCFAFAGKEEVVAMAIQKEDEKEKRQKKGEKANPYPNQGKEKTKIAAGHYTYNPIL